MFNTTVLENGASLEKVRWAARHRKPDDHALRATRLHPEIGWRKAVLQPSCEDVGHAFRRTGDIAPPERPAFQPRVGGPSFRRRISAGMLRGGLRDRSGSFVPITDKPDLSPDAPRVRFIRKRQGWMDSIDDGDPEFDWDFLGIVGISAILRYQAIDRMQRRLVRPVAGH
jgi:hypothetical protein